VAHDVSIFFVHFRKSRTAVKLRVMKFSMILSMSMCCGALPQRSPADLRVNVQEISVPRLSPGVEVDHLLGELRPEDKSSNLHLKINHSRSGARRQKRRRGDVDH
jgi:hypothetical protein